MPKRYHVNPNTGRVNLCDANLNNPRSTGCKFTENGQEPAHFATKEQAREHRCNYCNSFV